MKSIQQITVAFISLSFLAGTYSCQQPGYNSTGSEFIPDMSHSIAYEANVNSFYSLNSWDEESVVSRRKLSMPRLPVAGTIPRGYSAVSTSDGTYENPEQAVEHTMKQMHESGGITYTPNGSVPYYYPDTEEGRTLATAQIKYNPFPITQAGIARGQELYNIYCGICHGGSGEGNGYLVRDNGGKYPAQPANFLLEDLINSNNGRYYHSIMYGKNAMGPYADKLSYEERWDVIHFIRSLQAKSKKLKYDATVNQLNPDYGVPMAMVKQNETETTAAPSEPEMSEENNSDQENHGHEH